MRAPKGLVEQYSEEARQLIEKFGPNFDKKAVTFTVNIAEQRTIEEWYKALVPEILELQQAGGVSDGLGEPTEPYYGAIGGGLTYSITPTGLGNILTVTESTTKKTLNVTEALDWHFFG